MPYLIRSNSPLSHSIPSPPFCQLFGSLATGSQLLSDVVYVLGGELVAETVKHIADIASVLICFRQILVLSSSMEFEQDEVFWLNDFDGNAFKGRINSVLQHSTLIWKTRIKCVHLSTAESGEVIGFQDEILGKKPMQSRSVFVQNEDVNISCHLRCGLVGACQTANNGVGDTPCTQLFKSPLDIFSPHVLLPRERVAFFRHATLVSIPFMFGKSNS